VRGVARLGGAILALEPASTGPVLGDARPVGSARFVVDRTGGHLAYERLAVHPALRGRGIGTAMIDWLEAHARSLGLAEVRADARSQMPDNRPFYLARGYEITGYGDRYGIARLRTHLRKRLT
jgi:GNAT superfamily N-acetyltransferase